MSSNKPLLPSIFLVLALLLLAFASYNHRTSLSYRIQTVLSNPLPLPYPLRKVYPESGSTISIEQVNNRFPESICINLDPTQELTFDDIILKINEVDYIFWTSTPVMGSIDYSPYCFYYINFIPGRYLIDLNMEKLGIHHFQWAFTITEN